MSLKIRPLQSRESDFLAVMLYEAIFIPEGHTPLPRAVSKAPSLSKYIDNWGKDTFDIPWVVNVGHQLVGAIWGRLLTADNKGFGYVDDHTPELSMALIPAYRNQGLGTRLLKAIAAEYQHIEVGYLSLSVDKANPTSHLYKRLGYEIVEETTTSWTMKKRVS